MNLRRIAECLDLDLDELVWRCNRCGHNLGAARRNYKEGCLVYERDPRAVHRPFGPHSAYNYSVDPEWLRILEFYCPNCAVMLDVEYLPPGHPPTWDIELDLQSLQARRRQAAAGDGGRNGC